jgi:hypothetical protein
MGTEFRGIAISSCISAVVGENQIHNCWIGGPYQSLLDDSVTEPDQPPTLANEERFDPLNALNTRDLVVRNNVYRNVAVGPYWNMGGYSNPVPSSAPFNTLSYDAQTGLVTVTTPGTPALRHHLWYGAHVIIEGAADARYNGLHEITVVTDTTFQYRLQPSLPNLSADTARYRIVSGLDFLIIESNHIELLDLDDTEFAIKEYPLAGAPASQKYRAYGIVIGDNGLSTLAGPHAHRSVLIRHNLIGYTDLLKTPTVAGLGAPAGAGMQLAGIKHLEVIHNVLDLNTRNPLRTFRGGPARFFNNKQPGGKVVPGWKWDTDGHYDEPETVLEDAFILWLLRKRKL